MLHLGVITLLPEMFASLDYGVIGRATAAGLVKIDYWNPRDWSKKTYGQIDDKPYGGGPGMVMMYEPLNAALLHAKSQMPKTVKTIYLSPQGKIKRQVDINHIAEHNQHLLFIAGRYEGIDERIIVRHVDEEWSIGDFVISGGELAAKLFIDAIIRQLPGSLGNSNSAKQDSFMDRGLLDYPHYTRPAKIDKMAVPGVLLSGNHRDIERWRHMQSLGKSWLKRPDLLKDVDLSEFDQQLLSEFRHTQEDI